MAVPDTSPPPKTQAAVVVVEVSFREVAAIYDLYDYRRVIGTQEQPRVVYDARRAFGHTGADGDYEDELGRVVKAVSGDDMPGVYQSARVTGTAEALRTFARKQAAKISDKWIYVFASESKSGATMRLAAELYCYHGELQMVDLAANANKDVRTVGATKRSSLHLEIRTPDPKNRPQFWFLLSPHQIPWAGLDAMVATGKRLASRCHRLFDEFWTDVSVAGGDPMTFLQANDRVKAGTPVSFVLYLVDPFEEGLRRHALYVQALGLWQESYRPLEKDKEYRLAKRLHALPAKYSDIVWPKMGSYLAEKEKLQRLLLRATTNRLEDLMRWIGETQKRGPWTSNTGGAGGTSDTWFVDGGKVGHSKETKEDVEWTNPFSELVGDLYRWTTPASIQRAVVEVVAVVHERLDDLPRGQDFLKKMIDDDFAKRVSLADGGSKVFFEALRKTNSAVTEFVGGDLLKTYAKEWVKAYQADALPQLVEFMRKRHGIELKQIRPHATRRAEQAIARRAHAAASERGIARLAKHYHISPEPLNARALGMTAKSLHQLALGVEVVNLTASIYEFVKEKDPWAAIGLLGSTLDAYAAVETFYPKIGQKTYTVGGVKKVVKLTPAFTLLSTAIDTLMAGRDAVNATNFGQQFGQSLRTIGAALTVGGAVTSSTGLGAALTVLGLGLQGFGNWISSEFDDMKQYLRHTKWGETIGRDEWFDALSDKNAFGYRGKLSELHKDIDAQHRALDWLLYAFKPKLTVRDGDVVIPGQILLEMNPPKGLGPDATWSVQLDVVRRDNQAVIKSYVFKAAEATDHVSISSNEKLAVASKERGDLERWGAITIRGKIQLDVRGDGQYLVTREIDEIFYRKLDENDARDIRLRR